MRTNYLNLKGSVYQAGQRSQEVVMIEKLASIGYAARALGTKNDARAIHAEMNRRLTEAFLLIDTYDEMQEYSDQRDMEEGLRHGF